MTEEIRDKLWSLAKLLSDDKEKQKTIYNLLDDIVLDLETEIIAKSK